MNPQPSPLIVRPFRPADQDRVRALVLAGLGDHFGFIDETMNPDLDDIASSYLGQGASFVVAEQDGRIVGTGALILEAPGVGRLARMSVARELRGLGLGRLLVERLTREARNRGYLRLVCETNDDWDDAIGLYRACGFTEIGRWGGDVHFQKELGEGS